MRAAIIIGTYNNSLHISETLLSVLEQEFLDWECIIIDNGSLDNTVEIIKKIIEKDIRFSLYQKENEGPSAGRNYGYKYLSNSIDYIHFLDGDDKLHPSFLSKMIDYLENNRYVGGLGCQFEIIDEKGNYISSGNRSRFAPKYFGFPAPLKDHEFKTPFEAFFSATGQGPFAVFRNSVFEQTSGYEEDFWSHEDSDIFCQISLLSEIHYIPDRLYIKRTHSNNLTYSQRHHIQNLEINGIFISLMKLLMKE